MFDLGTNGFPEPRDHAKQAFRKIPVFNAIQLWLSCMGNGLKQSFLRSPLPVEPNYSINKHGIGNKTIGISLMTLSDACARDGKAESFPWHLCNDRDLFATLAAAAGINRA